MKKRCQFQGGDGLEEKYRPPSPCLGEFLVLRPCNEPRQKYCRVCAPFAKKWLNARNAAARYKAEPNKYAKVTRENRWKRRKAAGRPCPRLGIMVQCQYHDKQGRRGKGCLGRFERKSSFQKFCAVCQKHADANRAQDYRDRHPDKEKARQALRWKRQRDEIASLRSQAAQGQLLAVLQKAPESWGRILLYLLRNPRALNDQVRTNTGTDLSTAQMGRLRKLAGVPGPKGRPRKKT